MLRAVIFDFDGVIVDSEALHLRSFNRVLSRHGIKITTKDYYQDYLGLSDLDCFKLLISRGQLKGDPCQIEELRKDKNREFEKLAKTETSVIEGVAGFLQMLWQNDIPMAIYSCALLAEIELMLKQSHLRRFFEVIVSAEDVKKSKPDPEGFLLALQKLNQRRHFTETQQNNITGEKQNPILPEECVVIEDSHWGLEAANAAGMHTIAITNSYDAEQLAMAEKIISRLDELKTDDLQKLCV